MTLKRYLSGLSILLLKLAAKITIKFVLQSTAESRFKQPQTQHVATFYEVIE